MNEAVVLSMEQHTPPIVVEPSSSTTPYGLIDYTAAAAGLGLLQARLLSGSSGR